MCTSPILIQNKLQGHLNDNKYMVLKDCVSQRIYVPCGHCHECVSRRQNDIVQRVDAESLRSHIYFITLTYNNEHLPSITVGDREFAFADFGHLQDAIKRIRRRNLIFRPFRYLAVSEFGGRKGRPHFHLLLFVQKKEKDSYAFLTRLDKCVYDAFRSEWRVNVSRRADGKVDTFHPVYEPLYTHREKFVDGHVVCNFDCHRIVNSGTHHHDSVGYYVTKYITKDSKYARSYYSQIAAECARCGLDKEVARDAWNVVKPRMCKSLYFGLCPEDSPFGPWLNEEVTKKIAYGIQFAVDHKLQAPVWFDTVTGKTIPMAKYYLNKFITFKDAYYFKKDRIDTDLGCFINLDCTQNIQPGRVKQRLDKEDNVVGRIFSKYRDYLVLYEDMIDDTDPYLYFDF